MQADNLSYQITEQTMWDPECLVVFQNVETGEIFTILGVTYELSDSDENGDPLGTGTTLFIKGQPL